MRTFVLIGLLSLASAANAGVFSDDNSVHNSASATGGSATANGGRADSDAVSVSGASVKSDVDVKNSANSGSVSGAKSDQDQSQFQGQDQGINAFNGNTTVVNPNVKTDIKINSKDLRNHAESSAEVRGQSSDGETPCGDVSGVSAQGGLFGGALAVPSVACQTFRHEKLQDLYGNRASAKAEAVLFWFPGFLVRLVTYPISH